MRLNVQSEVNYLDPTDDHLGPDYEDCIQFDCLRCMAELTGNTSISLRGNIQRWNVMSEQFGAHRIHGKLLDHDEYDYTHGIRERLSVS